MRLPSEIHEILRYSPEPGDILIPRNTECEVSQQQADDIKKVVRRSLNLPDSVEIAVLGRDWEVTVGKVPE